MVRVNSYSDMTSLDTSSLPPPSPPKRAVYYVQSPSRDSHEDIDKSSSTHVTAVYSSPMGSPSHRSYSVNSAASAASRFSGHMGSGGGKNQQRLFDTKGRHECDVIFEEGPYGDLDADEGISRRWCQVALAVILLFAAFCLVIWGASRPYKPDVVVKSLSVEYFYSGSGSDNTGVPTKMITMNCSIMISIHNTASMYGIHVTSGTISLIYSQIPIATGELEKYYQRRKSHRTVSVVVQGDKVPLYGAGVSLALSSTGGTVPLTLNFDIISQGDVVGKLVRVKHRRHVSCPLVVDSSNAKSIKFSKDACTVE